MLMTSGADDPDVFSGVAIRSAFREQMVESAAQVDILATQLTPIACFLQPPHLGVSAVSVALRIPSLEGIPGDVYVPAEKADPEAMGFPCSIHRHPPSLV